MISVRGFYGIQAPPGRLLLGMLVTTLFAGTSTAEDYFVLTRDGRKVPLIRSSREFGVTLRSVEEAGPCAKRLLARGQGTLKDIAGAPKARIKLLEVSEATARRRAVLGEDPAITEVRPVYRYAGSETTIVSTGLINLKVRRGLTAQQRDQLWADHAVELVRPVEGLKRVYTVKPTEGENEVHRARALAEDHRTEWAQPSFRIPLRRRQVTAADEYYSAQWHLHNTGQAGGTTGADIDAPEAWLLSAEGQDVIIGMFDDGCDVDHEDLRGNYLGEGHDPSLSSNDEGFDDPRPKQIGDYHGTAVMGLAVARANSVGVRGVAHLARFTASRGLGDFPSDAEIASVYTFARQKEVDVLNYGSLIPDIIEEAIERAFIEGRDLDGEDGPERPRGMVVVFGSGNGEDNIGDGVPVEAGRELATLPTVIGVGASDQFDQIAWYSNYGPEIDVLAPGGDGFVGIVTTDIDDARGYADVGFNFQGIDMFTGFPDIDPRGLYTAAFGGTSAACPIAAGVAALALSANQNLTATDVRLILEHTAEQIDRNAAGYDGISSRSLKYGYGRINARAVVVAAQQAVTNGGRTWPERVAQVRAGMTQLRWAQNGDPLEFPEEDVDEDEPSPVRPPTTDEFLVLEGDAPFEFRPEDGACYRASQVGCASAGLERLPDGVSVAAVGCGLVCGTGVTGECEIGAEQCVQYPAPAATKYFAIYARNNIGRYSFGVRADTDGNVQDEGQLPPGGEGGGSSTPGPGDDTQAVNPIVTVYASLNEGYSPLTVRFSGNGVSPLGLGIDDARTSWDFDTGDKLGDGVSVNATKRTAQYTYVLPEGKTEETFIARLTMYDTAVPANVGWTETQITVRSSGSTGSTGGGTAGGVQIVVREQGGADEVTEGVSPFEAELSLQTAGVDGTVQGVMWDLGDGTLANTQQVSHTYVNGTQSALSLTITAEVTVLTTAGSPVNATAQQQITVYPGTAVDDGGDIALPGTQPMRGGGAGGMACGVLGFVPLLAMLAFLMGLRGGRLSSSRGGLPAGAGKRAS